MVPPRIKNPTRCFRLTAAIGLALAAGTLSGCARDRGQITPTTMGTDFSRVPRGQMVPQPFPGSSLARHPRRTGDDPSVLTAGSSDAVLR